MAATTLAPSGMLCQLLAHPERTRITASCPCFGWVVEQDHSGAGQTAYQLQSASSADLLDGDDPDLWDSGKVASGQSLNVGYGGSQLPQESAFWWRVRTWAEGDSPGPWSPSQQVPTGRLAPYVGVDAYPLVQSEIAPATLRQLGNGHWLADFGRAAFGTVRLRLSSARGCQTCRIHLGERLTASGRLDREPPGSIRYRCVELELAAGTHAYIVTIAPDQRNTGPDAILMPAAVGEVLPFRYCEIESAPCELIAEDIRQLAVHYPFDDEAAGFDCDDPLLSDIWELCRYSVKATSFCGYYVDGDRERIPYEADAYINQLCHYYADREFTLARRTHEYLMDYPTWPTEWILFSVMLAWIDYEYTGNTESLAAYYDDLRAKTLIDLERDDGLISAEDMTPELRHAVHLKHEMRDIVDWPPGSFTEGGQGERDGHEMMPVNTVVNAFHAHALGLMGRIAAALGRQQEAEFYAARGARVAGALNALLLDVEQCAYRDGEGSTHSSLHASMFPLAFGLVPAALRARVADFVESRGMACSVYGAQFMLEALYRTGRAQAALSLMTARHDRGWWNMMASGSTVTLEAWDWKFKNNLDWNHAWGAAPGNIIPRYLLGVRPLEPGFGRILVQPQLAWLRRATGKVPTIRGAVTVTVTNQPDRPFSVEVDIPSNTTAQVIVPRLNREDCDVKLDGVDVKAAPGEYGLTVEGIGPGTHRVERGR
jgi:alpha-L-rhamnosidase